MSLNALSENWRYLASPALWLFIAAVWFARGLPTHDVGMRAWQSWKKVAPVTGLFIGLGILMAASGMAAFLARTLAEAASVCLVAAPFVGALGGFVTGSNSGANAMFAATQGDIARSLGVDVLTFIAVHNVATSFLLMGSPGKIEMAIQLSPTGATNDRHWIQMTILLVAGAVVAMLSVINIALFGSIV